MTPARHCILLLSVYTINMAITFVRVKILNPADEKRQTVLQFMVDSGAIYSVVPKEILMKLGIKPHSKRIFTLANGETIERDIGDAAFDYVGERGAAPVIFGEKGDSALLGAVTLEALGLMLDPLRREIKPIPMVLGAMRRGK